MAEILDGRMLSTEIRGEVQKQISTLEPGQPRPTLAIVIATDDESSASYVRTIEKSAEAVGINPQTVKLGAVVTQEELNQTVEKLAEDSKVHGIILQTPVPEGINTDLVRSLIPPEKDVDGANPLSTGRLFSGLKSFAPATAAAVIEILKHYNIEISGKQATVIGRSRIVGKPVAQMLLDLNATVTVCHSKTKDITPYTSSADILVVAAGKIGLVSASHISDKTVVIDVGTNFSGQELVGDVDFASAEPKAKAITPVPGGVGPVTTAILLRNTLEAYFGQTKEY